jgi:hypothetical protein
MRRTEQGYGLQADQTLIGVVANGGVWLCNSATDR